MKFEHKRYILENINKKSIRKLAQELDIKEGKIRKFLEREKEKKKTKPIPKVRTPISKKTILISAALIVVLGFTVYANSYKGEFLWDDNFLIKNNVYIKNLSNIGEIFSKDTASGAGVKSVSYRPLQMLTYALDYSLWKLDARGYHFTNILLHIMASLCIFWLINILFSNKIVSLITCALFVVHPIHAGAISYISGRADSLALLFMALCFIFYIRHLDTGYTIDYIIGLFCYALALLSRENSLVLPALLLLYHYTFKKKVKLKEFLPILAIVFIYILWRKTVLKTPLPHTLCDSNLFQRIPGFFVAITNYTRLLFLPFNLHIGYGRKLFNFTDPKAIFGIIIVFSALIYAYRKKRTNSLIFFSVLWFFVTLLPSSNLYPLNAYMAEHWLYVPSIGFFLFLAGGLCRIYSIKKFKIFAGIFTIALLIFYSSLTIKQNSYWREPVALFKRTLEIEPNDAKAYNNLGFVYDSIGMREKAINFYKKAIEIEPNYADAYNNLGVAYSNIGMKKEAVSTFKKLLEIAPNSKEAYSNLGAIYIMMGMNQEAIELLKQAISIYPDYADMYVNLGSAYNAIGDREKPMIFYKKAIDINPLCAEAYNNLAVVYYDEKRYDLALKHAEKAVELGYKVDPELLRSLEPYQK